MGRRRPGLSPGAGGRGHHAAGIHPVGMSGLVDRPAQKLVVDGTQALTFLIFVAIVFLIVGDGLSLFPNDPT